MYVQQQPQPTILFWGVVFNRVGAGHNLEWFRLAAGFRIWTPVPNFGRTWDSPPDPEGCQLEVVGQTGHVVVAETNQTNEFSGLSIRPSCAQDNSRRTCSSHRRVPGKMNQGRTVMTMQFALLTRKTATENSISRKSQSPRAWSTSSAAVWRFWITEPPA